MQVSHSISFHISSIHYHCYLHVAIYIGPMYIQIWKNVYYVFFIYVFSTDIENFQYGIYLITIKREGRRYTKKIITETLFVLIRAIHK